MAAERPPRPAATAPEAAAAIRTGVHGRVIDEQGRPIAGADVLLIDHGLAEERAASAGLYRPSRDRTVEVGVVELRTRTDAGGRFALPDAPPGRYLVVASSADRPPIADKVVLAAKAVATGVELTLSPPCVLDGVARGLSGAPVAGAVVEAVLADATTRSATTGADGVFRLEGLPPVFLEGVGRLKAGSPPATTWKWHCSRGRLELGLPDPIGTGPDRIEGIVLRSGEPLAGAEIHRMAPAELAARTDDRGRFAFTVPAGATVHAQARAGAARSAEAALTPGQPVVLELREPGEVELHVADARGAPVAGATVVHGRPAESDLVVVDPSSPVLTGADGVARLTEVPVGTRGVLVTRSGFRPEQVEVHVRPRALSNTRVRLEPMHTLAVRTVRGGVPVVDGTRVHRSARGEGARTPDRVGVVGRVPGPDGVVRFDGLTAGRYAVHATLPDGRYVQAEARVPGPVLDLELPPGPPAVRLLAGRVLLPDGGPARETYVAAYCLEWEPEPARRELRALTDAGGRFRIEASSGCPRYLVRARGLLFRPERLADTEVGPGDGPIVLQLPRTVSTWRRRVEGIVIDEDRRAVPDQPVYIRRSDRDWEDFARTDEAGRFRFEDVADGPLELGIVAGTSLDLPAEATRVRLRIPRKREEAAPVLRARLVRPEGEPVTMVATRVTRTDPGGAYSFGVRLWNLPDGLLAVRVPPRADVELIADGLIPVTLHVPVRGAEVDAGTVRFEAEARLSGVVVRPDGTPVAGAAVELVLDGSAARGPLTNTAGWFLSPPVRPGRAAVLAKHPLEGSSRTAELVLAPGEAETRLVLEPPPR